MKLFGKLLNSVNKLLLVLLSARGGAENTLNQRMEIQALDLSDHLTSQPYHCVSGQDPLQVCQLLKDSTVLLSERDRRGSGRSSRSGIRGEDLPRFKPCHTVSLHSLRTVQEGWEGEARMSKRLLLPSSSQSPEISATALGVCTFLQKEPGTGLGKASWRR